MEIKGKVAIVTGASSGIGLATAKLLADEGVKVALVARDDEKLAGISSQIPESMFVVTDMTKETEIKDMVSEVFKHFGKIDILINLRPIQRKPFFIFLNQLFCLGHRNTRITL